MIQHWQTGHMKRRTCTCWTRSMQSSALPYFVSPYIHWKVLYCNIYCIIALNDWHFLWHLCYSQVLSTAHVLKQHGDCKCLNTNISMVCFWTWFSGTTKVFWASTMYVNTMICTVQYHSTLQNTIELKSDTMTLLRYTAVNHKKS